ncbi:MAG: hypothetical protein KDA22_13750 [Phycisphaerales bacterium]|nr:hypothetical protein [Phycisphaerales bacterium]
MSEETAAPPAPAPTEAPAKRSPVKLIVVVVVMLVVEAAGIMALMHVMRPPAEVVAVPSAEAAHDEGNEIVEIEVLSDRLANDRSGVTYIYPAEIYVQVRARHAEEVTAQLERFKNEIRADVLAIWRTAEPKHFQEPRLDHLTRRIHDLLNDRFESAPDAEEPIILKAVIVCGTGFRVG